MESSKMNVNGMQIDLTEILNLLAQNKKMEAIKLLKDKANLGLKEAKDFVEAIQDGSLNGVNINYNEHTSIEKNEPNIDGKRLDIVEILTLIKQGKKIEAVKFVYETAKISLKDAKETVDKIEAGNWDDFTKPLTNSNSERVNMEQINGSIKITYTDNNGEQSLVTPHHHLWAHVKKMVGKNDLLAEYENKFAKNEVVDYGSSVFVEEKGKNWKVIVVIIVILIILGYYLFTNFLH